MFTLKVTPDIELGLLELHHAEEIFALIDKDRAYLKEWMPWLDFNTSVTDSRKNVASSAQNWAERKSMSPAIIYQGKIVGKCSFNTLDWTNKKTEIGYWLGQEFQGKGIVTACVRFLTTYAFEEFGLNRVEIHCATQNVKSRALPERLGYVHEGTVRDGYWLNDKFGDMEIYGMLARDWVTE